MLKLFEVDKEQSAGLMACFEAILTCEGELELSVMDQRMLAAIGQYLLHRPEGSASISSEIPKNIADLITVPALRQEVLDFATLLPLIEREHQERKFLIIEKLSTLLGMKHSINEQTHDFLKDRRMRFMLDAARDESSIIHTSVGRFMWNTIKAKLHFDGNSELKKRFESYESAQKELVGHQMFLYYKDNKFPLPGTIHSVFSNTLMLHDFQHVLSGYPTSPLGEMSVAAFDGSSHGIDLIHTMISCLFEFHLGIGMSKAGEVWVNQFQPEEVMRAYERGKNITEDYTSKEFDIFSVFDFPLSEVRKRFNISETGVEGKKVLGPGVKEKWCSNLGPISERVSKDKLSSGSIKFSEQ